MGARNAWDPGIPRISRLEGPGVSGDAENFSVPRHASEGGADVTPGRAREKDCVGRRAKRNEERYLYRNSRSDEAMILNFKLKFKLKSTPRSEIETRFPRASAEFNSRKSALRNANDGKGRSNERGKKAAGQEEAGALSNEVERQCGAPSGREGATR